MTFKKIKNSGLVIGAFVLGVMVMAILNNVFASEGDPGTINDPLVSKSYLDEQNATLMSEVNTMIEALELAQAEAFAAAAEEAETDDDLIYMEDLYAYVDNKFETIESEGIDVSSGFVVIELQKDQQLICDESAELILRSGQAIAMGNTAGDGISDVTAGADIKNDESVKLNHLIIVPRTDGRGIQAVEMCYVLVKGNYVIQ